MSRVDKVQSPEPESIGKLILSIFVKHYCLSGFIFAMLIVRTLFPKM